MDSTGLPPSASYTPSTARQRPELRHRTRCWLACGAAPRWRHQKSRSRPTPCGPTAGTSGRYDGWLLANGMESGDQSLALYLAALDGEGKALANASTTFAAVKLRDPAHVGRLSQQALRGYRRGGRSERGRGQAASITAGDVDAMWCRPAMAPPKVSLAPNTLRAYRGDVRAIRRLAAGQRHGVRRPVARALPRRPRWRRQGAGQRLDDVRRGQAPRSCARGPSLPAGAPWLPPRRTLGTRPRPSRQHHRRRRGRDDEHGRRPATPGRTAAWNPPPSATARHRGQRPDRRAVPMRPAPKRSRRPRMARRGRRRYGREPAPRESPPKQDQPRRRGRRARICTAKVARALRALRSATGGVPDAPVFVGHQGGLSAASVNRRVQALAKAAGIEGKVSAHSARRCRR